jgi:hypothetical protein
MKTTPEERSFTIWLKEKREAILEGFRNGPNWFQEIDPAFRAAGLVITISELINLLERFPNKALQEVAKGRADWPAMIQRKKLPNPEVLSNMFARHYFGRINAHRNLELHFMPEPERDEIGKLPDFTVKTARQWGSIAWNMLCEDYGGQPEANRYIAQLGEHRRAHSVNEGAQARATRGTVKANVRDGIRESLRLAFMRLAKLLDSSPTASPKS